jgi:hypothetical protein
MTQDESAEVRKRLRELQAKAWNADAIFFDKDGREIGSLDLTTILDSLSLQSPSDGASFQARVQPWMMACFGAEISADKLERNHRFFEEATETVQAAGMTRSEAHQLVDYTFDRPIGELRQEAGGAMVTLAALCLAHGLDMHEAGEIELARVWTKVDAIRAKQAAKPKHSPLPASPSVPVGEEDRARALDFAHRYGQANSKGWCRIHENDLINAFLEYGLSTRTQALREMRERAAKVAEEKADHHEADRNASTPGDASYYLWARQSANHVAVAIRALPLDDKGERA